MRVKSKHIAGLLAGLVLLVGCGKTAQDPNMITVWHWMVDRHSTFEALADQYKQETGVTVNVQLFAPSDVYSQKIIAAAQANILPDIFGVLDKKSIVGEFIKGGFVANLTADFDADDGAWHRSFFDEALATNIFEEGNFYGVPAGIYAVPLDVSTEMVVYNKELLKKAGVTQVPQTFEEFLEAAQKIRSIGVTPFVSGWAELWLIECFASNYAFNIMGEEKVMATYRGEVPYTDPDWIEVFKLFDTLAKEGVIQSGIVTKINKTAEQDFALQRAAFAFNGSWGVNVYEKMMNPKFEYGVMLPPRIAAKEHDLKIWGSAGSSLMVNARSPNKEKAIAFLKWLSAKKQQVFFAEQTQNLPANRYALVSLPEEIEGFSLGMEHATHPSMWPVEEDVLVREKFNKGVQSIIIGESTPEEAARQVQEVKARQMERARRR